MSAPRGWFQIHLMTAIVLMFAAGGVIELNFALGRQVQIVSGYNFVEGSFDPVLEKIRMVGWPLTATELDNQTLSLSGSLKNMKIESTQTVQRQKIVWTRMLVNVLVGVGILIVVAVVCELFLRRKRRTA